MRLNQTIFDEVIAGLGAVPENEGEPRRRQAPRYHVDREIMIKPFGVVHSVARYVNLINISATGVCVIDNVPASAGSQFVIYIPRPSGGTIDVLCIIRQSRLTNTGVFRVGAEFASEMDRNSRIVRGANGIVTAHTGPKVPDSDSDLHRPARIRLPSGQISAQSVAAEIQSYSNGVFGIATSSPVTAGERFVLECNSADGRTQGWTCTVLNARLTSSSTFLVSARNDGPINISQPAGSMWKWFKRLVS